jgi:hypothetical protein
MVSHHPQSTAPVVNLRDYRPPSWVPPMQGVSLGLSSEPASDEEPIEDRDCPKCGEPLVDLKCEVGCLDQDPDAPLPAAFVVAGDLIIIALAIVVAVLSAVNGGHW